MKPIACKKLEKIIKGLAFKVKIKEEFEELKEKELLLGEKLHVMKEEAALKLHEELEEIKKKKLICEAQFHEEAEEFKEKLELIGHEINPVEKIKLGFLKFKAYFE